MPFVSEAQRRKLHADMPELAAKWEAHTPKDQKLPERVTPVTRKRKKDVADIYKSY